MRIARRSRTTARGSAARCWINAAWHSRQASTSGATALRSTCVSRIRSTRPNFTTAWRDSRSACGDEHAQACTVTCLGTCRLRRHGNGRLLLAGRVGPARHPRALETDSGSHRRVPDANLRQRLARVQEIRAFASRELGLPDNASYTKYADLGRPFVVWNVFAAPELSLTPRQWCFPVAGCVSYRGYFNESEARAEAARLQAAGDDVWVSGVPAYSTLGYFDDPVLSTFIRWPDIEVARMVFHELAHQVVYVKDDTQFNESFAVAVEEAGVERWLALNGNAQLDTQYSRSGRLRAVFRDLTRDTRANLARIYASDAPDAVKRSEKAAAFASMRAGYELAKAGEPGLAGYDRWFAGAANAGPNNA